MGVLTDDELNKLPISAQIDQTKSADLANSTANQPQALPDDKNVLITNFTADTACLSGNTDISFNLELINPSSTLSKDYKVSVTIYNDETEENYEIVDNPEWDLFGQTNTFGNYTFNLSDMTPTCTGLSSGVTYTFLVDLDNSFSLEKTLESNCTGTTPTVGATTTTTNNSANEVVSCISIVSVTYERDSAYTISVKLAFTPKFQSANSPAVSDFILPNTVTGLIYLKSNTDNSQKEIGGITMLQNDFSTVLFETYSNSGGPHSLLISSGNINKNQNTISRDNIQFNLFIDKDDTITFVDDILKNNQPPSFGIRWSTGSVFNARFPYP